MRGLSVSIYRNGSDCTNGGATSPAKAEGKIVLLFDRALRRGNWEFDESADDDRFICLEVRRRGDYVYAVPMYGTPKGVAGPMFGGNYVCTSDSRFSEAFGSRPIPVHDRFDTWEDHERLSR